MKNLKKIATIMLMTVLIILCTTVVNAAEGITISEGTRKGNIVTFKITLPEGAGLLGDVNSDGVVNNDDVVLFQDWLLNRDTENVNSLLADIDNNGELDVFDMGFLKRMANNQTENITLIGTLAKDSKCAVNKSADGTYSIDVTIPGNANGTIGISVAEKVFKLKDKTVNQKIDSKLLTVSEEDKYDATIKISDGKLDGNKVTFNVEAPKGTVLLGDVNSDGKLDSEDVVKLQNFTLGKGSEGINWCAADCSIDGEVDTFDLTMLKRIIGNKDAMVKLDGTLAEKSTYELVKNSDNTYSIIVTLPKDSNAGTIGVTVAENTFKTEKNKINKKISSALFNFSISNESNDSNEEFKVVDVKKEDIKDSSDKKVTLTVNKELDSSKIPEGWTLSNDKKSITKNIPEGKEEKVTLIAKDGSKIDYTVKVEKQNDEKDNLKVNKKDEKQKDGKVKVTLTANKELDPSKIPEGWTLSEDGKSIWKIMKQGAEEKITIVAKDGSKLEYNVVAEKYENKEDDSKAPTDIPRTGVSYTLIGIIAVIVIVGTVIFVKQRKMLK